MAKVNSSKKAVLYEATIVSALSTLLESVKNILDIRDFPEALRKCLSEGLRFGEARTITLYYASQSTNRYMVRDGMPLNVKLRSRAEYAWPGDFEIFEITEGWKRPLVLSSLSHIFNRRVIFEMMLKQIPTPVYTYLPNTGVGPYGKYIEEVCKGMPSEYLLKVAESVQQGAIWGPRFLPPEECEIFKQYCQRYGLSKQQQSLALAAL